MARLEPPFASGVIVDSRAEKPADPSTSSATSTTPLDLMQRRVIVERLPAFVLSWLAATILFVIVLVAEDASVWTAGLVLCLSQIALVVGWLELGACEAEQRGRAVGGARNLRGPRTLVDGLLSPPRWSRANRRDDALRPRGRIVDAVRLAMVRRAGPLHRHLRALDAHGALARASTHLAPGAGGRGDRGHALRADGRGLVPEFSRRVSPPRR